MTASYDFANSITAPDYANNKPFPWTKLDGLDLIPETWLDEMASIAKLMLRDKDVWHHYQSPIEKKIVLKNGIAEKTLPGVIAKLHSPDWLKSLSELSGIDGLQPDESFYGAGLSVVPSGGYLGLHKDLQLHPESHWDTNPLERRLNLALFLNREWQDDWGGMLELWSECSHGKPLKCAKRIRPQFGRIVLFDPNGFHGFPDPIACPPDVFRLSLQLFYYAPMRAVTALHGARKRAWFELRPGEDPAKVINDFRLVGRSKP